MVRVGRYNRAGGKIHCRKKNRKREVKLLDTSHHKKKTNFRNYARAHIWLKLTKIYQQICYNPKYKPTFCKRKWKLKNNSRKLKSIFSRMEALIKKLYSTFSSWLCSIAPLVLTHPVYSPFVDEGAQKSVPRLWSTVCAGFRTIFHHSVCCYLFLLFFFYGHTAYSSLYYHCRPCNGEQIFPRWKDGARNYERNYTAQRISFVRDNE